MSVTIRRATVEDAPAIAEVHVRSWQHAYAGLVPQSLLDGLDLEQGTARWTERLTSLDSPARRAVAEVDGVVVGFVVVGPSHDGDAPDDTGELAAIYLLPDQLGRGVGHRLHGWAMTELETLGMRSARLWVLTTNRRAREFYGREGWRHDGVDGDHEKNGVSLAATRYSRDLALRDSTT